MSASAVRTVRPKRAFRVGILHAGLALAALAGLDARDAAAQQRAWCAQSGGTIDPNTCVYDSFVECLVAAIRSAGYCHASADLGTAAFPVASAEPAGRRAARPPSPARSTPAAAQRTAHRSSQPRDRPEVERERLFQEFLRWKEERANR